MSKPFQISILTVVSMVLLRLLIGGHFFSQGLDKLDPNFSAAGFLSQAKGPLAPAFQGVLPDFHDWNKLMAQPREDKPAAEGAAAETSYGAWKSKIEIDWLAYVERAKKHFAFNEEQKTKADTLYKYYVRSLATYLEESEQEVNEYRHDLFRLKKMRATPIAEQVPFQQQRIQKKAAETAAKANQIKAAVTAMEKQFQQDLRELATREQYAAAKDMGSDSGRLATVNMAVTYVVLGVGVCLILGLFTRLASVVGALFLLSVILTQPFWVAGAAPTWEQGIEMLALLMLASSHVGRWAGLDFFIHALLVAPFSKSK